MMSRKIAITIGDIQGIGIEILIKSFREKQISNFILFININKIKKYLQKKKINIKLNIIDTKKKDLNYKKDCLNIFSYSTNSSIENTYKSLRFAYDFCKKIMYWCPYSSY